MNADFVDAKLRAPDLSQVALGAGSRLDERRRPIRPRVSLNAALLRTGIGPPHPGFETARKVADRDEHPLPDVRAEEAQKRVESFLGKNGRRHASNVRLGRVIPEVPVDAE